MNIKHSETISELAKALVKFNARVGKISKDAKNPFFKNNYATLDNIINEVRPILSEFGLNILQLPSSDGEHIKISTLLMHESGEWLESDGLTMKPVKNDPQGMGSAITYARRYALQSFLSLNTGEDDDGNNASQPKKQQEPLASQEQIMVFQNKAQEYCTLKGQGTPDEIYKSFKIDFDKVTSKEITTHIRKLDGAIAKAIKEAVANEIE